MKKLKILLIDDNSIARDEIKIGLKKQNIEVELIFQIPGDPEQNCFEYLPSIEEISKFDLIFVDLELYSTFLSSTEFIEKDLSGGTAVLPFLREIVPWIPVIAVSKLFATKAEIFTSFALSFGFDGHFPKTLFVSNKFDNEIWNELIKKARINRRSFILGHQISSLDKSVEVNIDPDFEKKLSESIHSVRKLIESTFHFAKKVTIEKIAPGFSGAITLKAFTNENGIETNREGEWLLKISNNPLKLHQELLAHQNMIQSGLGFTLGVNLLWRGVISEEGHGAIVYQFATGSKEAAELLKKPNEIHSTIQSISPTLTSFYGDCSTNRVLINDVLNSWALNHKDLLLKTRDYEGKFKNFLNNTNDKIFETSLNVTYNRIHGDLHSSNIMIGKSQNILIDFALSKHGPITIDAAKLISDLTLRIKDLRISEILGWMQLIEKFDFLLPLKESFKLNEDDQLLFHILFKSYLIKSLRFSDIDTDIKDWICDTVS